MPAGHDAFDGNGHSSTGLGEKKEEEKKRKKNRWDGEDGVRDGREGREEWLNGWRVVLRMTGMYRRYNTVFTIFLCGCGDWVGLGWVSRLSGMNLWRKDT